MMRSGASSPSRGRSLQRLGYFNIRRASVFLLKVGQHTRLTVASAFYFARRKLRPTDDDDDATLRLPARAHFTTRPCRDAVPREYYRRVILISGHERFYIIPRLQEH